MGRQQTLHSFSNTPHLPNFFLPCLVTQALLSVVMIIAGTVHIAVRGAYAFLGTGIYCGLFALLATYFEATIWRKNRLDEPIGGQMLMTTRVLVALAILLTFLDVPIVAVISLIFGDIFGVPYKDCRWEGRNSDFDCVVISEKINAAAVLCDVTLILTGLGNGAVSAVTGYYILLLDFMRQGVKRVTTV